MNFCPTVTHINCIQYTVESGKVNYNIMKHTGEKLTKLNSGDSVAVTVGESIYKGTITEKKRWKCELVGGFMQSGDIRVQLQINPELVESHQYPASYILITATEDAPHDWDTPQASFYDPTQSEVITQIGNVNEVDIMGDSGE